MIASQCAARWASIAPVFFWKVRVYMETNLFGNQFTNVTRRGCGHAAAINDGYYWTRPNVGTTIATNDLGLNDVIKHWIGNAAAEN